MYEMSMTIWFEFWNGQIDSRLEGWPNFLGDKWNVRKGLWLPSIRNSRPSVIMFHVMPEDKSENFVAFHTGENPQISSTPLGPLTIQPAAADISVIEFELGYGGCQSMTGSAMMILRATLSENTDSFDVWRQQIIMESDTIFPGLCKAFATRPTEMTLLLVALFPEVV